MQTCIHKKLSLAILLLGVSSAAFGASVFATRPDDPRAVHLIAPEFGAHADGIADDTAAIQAAIDKTQFSGIVFVAPGRYRITHTVYVSPGVRIFGYGPTRPVFVLAANTPGFQKGLGTMVMFTNSRSGRGGRGRVPFPPPDSVPPNPNATDANENTFYSALSNVDFEIGDGNPAAVAIRAHWAQHGYLSHIDFHLGSGFAGIYQAGNEAEDLHFFGGRYGIVTEQTSPGWQFTLVDSEFQGQRDASIREHVAGLTLIRDWFHDVPTAIDIDPQYYDQLWVKDSRFENIAGQVVIISSEKSPLEEVGFENAVLKNAPVLALLRESGKKIAGKGAIYKVAKFNYGVIVPAGAPVGSIGTIYEGAPLSAMPAKMPPAIPALPPTTEWVNVTALGVVGDGRTDNTDALRKAIDQHKALYFPSGNYVVHDTITLKPDTAIIGLHSSGTQIVLPDTPAFQGFGKSRAVIETAAGGNAILTGIGISTNGPNPRAVGVLWRAGEGSLMDDVHFGGSAAPGSGVGGGGGFGGGGGAGFGGGAAPAGGAAAGGGAAAAGAAGRGGAGGGGAGGGAAAGAAGRGGAGGGPAGGGAGAAPALGGGGRGAATATAGVKGPSLWIDGGGGVFADIWTPDTSAQLGFLVTNTKIPGHVYELSNEHHVFNEIKLDHVENWDINAPQTEEEAADNGYALSLELEACKNITIANYHAYRVTRTRVPFPTAARVYNSSGIHFRNVHVNAESGYPICDANGCATFLRISKYPDEDSIEDVTHHVAVREREFAVLDIPAAPPAAAPADNSAILEPGAKVKMLDDGFYSASGGAVDAAGKLYFTDRHEQRIYGWSASEGLTIERDLPLDPVNLAVDKAGDLLVLSFQGPEGTVYAFHPGSPKEELTVLTPQPSQPHPGAHVILPVNYWNNGEFKDQLDLDTYVFKTLAQMFQEDVSAPKAKEYVSPDGSVFLPAFRVFQQDGDGLPGGWRFSDTMDTYGFVNAAPGSHIYVSSEEEDTTYKALVKPDGTLGDLQPFARRGGESVAVDAKGNVYVANGEIFVYDPAGKQIGRIDVPERPLDIVFGGADGRTLFILAHHALFSVKVKGAGTSGGTQ